MDRSLLNIARQRHGPVGARVGVAPSVEGPAQPARAVEEGGRGALAAGGSSRGWSRFVVRQQSLVAPSGPARGAPHSYKKPTEGSVIPVGRINNRLLTVETNPARRAAAAVRRLDQVITQIRSNGAKWPAVRPPPATHAYKKYIDGSLMVSGIRARRKLASIRGLQRAHGLDVSQGVGGQWASISAVRNGSLSFGEEA